MTVFSSAGNDRLNTDIPGNREVPKGYNGVISVGAIDANGRLAKYSNYGPLTVDFLAPGDQIVSSTMDGLQGVMSGTSMAAPMATSIFTLLYGVALERVGQRIPRPVVKAWVLDVMCRTARKVPAQSRCGILDLSRGVAEVLSGKVPGSMAA